MSWPSETSDRPSLLNSVTMRPPRPLPVQKALARTAHHPPEITGAKNTVTATIPVMPSHNTDPTREPLLIMGSANQMIARSRKTWTSGGQPQPARDAPPACSARSRILLRALPG